MRIEIRAIKNSEVVYLQKIGRLLKKGVNLITVLDKLVLMLQIGKRLDWLPLTNW